MKFMFTRDERMESLLRTQELDFLCKLVTARAVRKWSAKKQKKTKRESYTMKP